MKSMTGYGKGEVSVSGKTITIELKSVNNRYLEINSRLPKSLSYCDDIIRKEIQKVVRRGSVDVFFNYDNKSEDGKVITADMALAKEYFNVSTKLCEEFDICNDYGATALMRAPEVIKLEYGKDDPELIMSMVKDCVVMAVSQLNDMREIEGQSAKDNFIELIDKISTSLDFITTKAPQVVTDYRQKLTARIQELLDSVEIDEARLLNEVAFFTDKADINEEISRLGSHISQFMAALDSDDAQGRRLDFISQEMNREINTIGSKSNDLEISNAVITLKNELEKVKEQIRNVE